MPKLIVTRPRLFADRRRTYHILIDGERAATIAPGKTVEIDLPPGRHRVAAQLGFLTSQPVEMECGPAEIRHLQVGSNLGRRSRLNRVLALTMLAPYAIVLITLACSHLFKDTFEAHRFIQFMVAVAVWPILLYFALLVIWRDRLLYIEEVRDLGPTTRRVALPDEPSLRVRITIRGMMVAVALVAILFWATMEWGRYTRQEFFRQRATYHGILQDQFRKSEQEFRRKARSSESSGLKASANFVRQYATKAAAKADYHAAMKRKYEEVIDRRQLFVEPDPPEPPWP